MAASGGDDDLRPYLSKAGAFHGHNVALLEKDEAGCWRPRPQQDLETIFSAGYGFSVDLSLRMQGLVTVAKALNANSPCLAAIALVQTRIPPLPDPLAAERMAQAGELAKGASNNPAQPRIPAGQPGAGQWMAGVVEALSTLAGRGLPWLAQMSARLAAPLARATHGCPGKRKRLRFLTCSQPTVVLPGLVPGIHARPRAEKPENVGSGAAWMAGTSPAMTTLG